MVTILISIILCFTISTISLLPLEHFIHFPLHVISLLLFFCRRSIGLMLPAGKKINIIVKVEKEMCIEQKENLIKICFIALQMTEIILRMEK